MSTDERRRLQNERLGRMVERIFDGPVPLFQDKLLAAGVTAPGDIATVDDLAGVPSTVKQDLRDSEAALPPWGDYRFTDPRQAVRSGHVDRAPPDSPPSPSGHDGICGSSTSRAPATGGAWATGPG
jgi:hypothetical protein